MDKDPQLAAWGMFPEVEHPEIGKIRVDGFPFKLSKTPLEIRKASPLLGEDNNYVYGELLGLSQEEIQDLAKEGAI